MTELLSDAPDVIESHYLETHEGLFFAVKGLVHPPARFFACLRYAPDPDGERQRQGRRYRRLYHFADQERFLRVHHPRYLAFDPVCQTILQSVPRSSVRCVYDPRRRLQDLARERERDPVEEDALAFASLLQREAGIPWAGLGLSGSLLIGLHTPRSDLDISVYGSQNCYAVQRALRRLLGAPGGGEVRRLDPQGMEALYAERQADTHMSFTDFVRIERDKVIQGRFRDRPYFIRFLKDPAETGERYGDIRYTPMGRMGITATIADASEAIFTPCRYTLATVRLLDSALKPSVEARPIPPTAPLRTEGPLPTEVVSYRGRFCEQAQVGDTVVAFGALEQVQAWDGRVWHRLLLGNHPEDTMLLTEVSCER